MSISVTSSNGDSLPSSRLPIRRNTTSSVTNTKSTRSTRSKAPLPSTPVAAIAGKTSIARTPASRRFGAPIFRSRRGARGSVDTARPSSERLQKLDEVGALRVRELEAQHRLVVRDDRLQILETTVVIKARRLAREEPAQRRGPVELLVGGAAGLEIVDADLVRGVHRPTRLRVKGRHVARRALRLAVEGRFAALGRRLVERVLRRLRCRDGELVEMERR